MRDFPRRAALGAFAAALVLAGAATHWIGELMRRSVKRAACRQHRDDAIR